MQLLDKMVNIQLLDKMVITYNYLAILRPHYIFAAKRMLAGAGARLLVE